MRDDRTTMIMLLLAGFVAGGCAASIGDSCSTNVECSPQGERICDRAQVEGYCTIQGCGANTCPDESVCIRFFPTALLSTPCDPRSEDATNLAVTPTNDCASDETCLLSGLCVLRSQEQRFCMFSCEDDSDCRDGYECRRAGTRGAEAVLDPENLGLEVGGFCAQKG